VDRVDVTVLFATVNRAAQLTRTLAHCAELNTTGLTWQLIVVDNGSTDDTSAVLTDAATRLPLLALRQPEPGKNRALNLGLPHASGAMLVFTDDDIVPDKGWLQELVRVARDWPTHDVFAGRITPRFPEGTPAWVRAHPFGRGAFAHFDLDQPEGPTSTRAFGGNFAIRAEVAARHQFNEDIGPRAGADYVMGSETEYLLRLQRAGHTTVYAPTAKVEHIIEAAQTTPEWILTRSYRLGRGLTRIGLSNRSRAPLLWGVPLYLMPRIVMTWLRYRLSPMRSTSRQFDIALEYYFLRGSIHELRLMSRETPQA
jgi:glycosyltransferase involved in cell wall biosynthesis